MHPQPEGGFVLGRSKQQGEGKNLKKMYACLALYVVQVDERQLVCEWAGAWKSCVETS
jgi:hypothetical protein